MHKDTEWMQYGLCSLAEDKDMWFPDPVGSNARTQVAKSICRECPVLQECAEYAVTFPTTLRGIWGGMTFRELRAARRKRGLRVMSEHEFSQLPVEGRGYYSREH